MTMCGRLCHPNGQRYFCPALLSLSGLFEINGLEDRARTGKTLPFCPRKKLHNLGMKHFTSPSKAARFLTSATMAAVAGLPHPAHRVVDIANNFDIFFGYYPCIRSSVPAAGTPEFGWGESTYARKLAVLWL